MKKVGVTVSLIVFLFIVAACLPYSALGSRPWVWDLMYCFAWSDEAEEDLMAHVAAGGDTDDAFTFLTNQLSRYEIASGVHLAVVEALCIVQHKGTRSSLTCEIAEYRKNTKQRWRALQGLWGIARIDGLTNAIPVHTATCSKLVDAYDFYLRCSNASLNFSYLEQSVLSHAKKGEGE